MRFVTFLLVAALTVWLHLVLDNRLGEAPLLSWGLASDNPAAALPPLGKLLNPFCGFMANAESPEEPTEMELDLPELQAPVQVVWDSRLVPHIFAQNDHDLYYTQGYVTARLRLWQMDTQTRQAAGRLSEFVGPRTLDRDRYYRRIGMREAAERSLEHMAQDSATRIAVAAYTAGINAYIQDMAFANWPVEYKILNYEPEAWTELKTALLLKMMAWTLTAGDRDLALTMARQTYGPGAADSLFPSRLPFQDPVIPPSRKWEFDNVRLPAVPTHWAADSAGYLARFPQPAEGTGSNNWAVAGSRTATGYPMLANDPHLDLRLPSIWLEVQLAAPGVNVYGASLPGAPAVIIGFNDSVAWGVTNVGADVMDWYRIQFRDDGRKEYLHDGLWKPVRLVEEKIAIRGHDSVVLQVRYTHHGPVVLENSADLADPRGTPIGCAMRWMAHEAGNEFMTFHRLNRARNYADYTEALRTYVCPAQNFVFASTSGDIALWCNGKYPLKWKNQGKFVLDGANPAHDWQGWVPWSHNPSVRNPERGFVSSANQESTAPDYPYYLGAWYSQFQRGARINQVLAGFRRATPDSLRLLQNDIVSLEAEKILPQLLRFLRPNRFAPNTPEALAANSLAHWNFRMDPNQTAPSVFTHFWMATQRLIWRDEFGKPGLLFPGADVTMYWLLTDTSLRWYDNTQTPQRETMRAIIWQAFDSTLAQLKAEHGPDMAAWAWGRYQNTQVPHMSFIEPFGRYNLNAPGCALCVNSTKPDNGPSWRMVVALHPDRNRAEAFGLYPGGQSGNPGSPFFDNMVSDWVAGRLHRLWFLASPQAANTPAPDGPTLRSTWTLN